MSKFVLICIFPTLAYVLFYLHLLSSAITYPTPNASTIDAKKMTNSFEDIQDRLPNLPILGWQIMKNLTSDEKQGCSQYPDILDIEYRNKYWQIFKTYYSSNIREATYHLYGAYLDNRTLLTNGMTVRILAMVSSREVPTLMPFCHIWYNDTKVPVVSQVSEFGKADNRLGGYPNPEKGLLDTYHLGCVLPENEQHRIPVSVSLLTMECPGDESASNNLRIYFKRNTNGKKNGITVCSKGLNHIDDTSIRFMEWIEVLRLVGVNKIVLYVLDVHPNVMKVFDYYISLGVLEVTMISLAGGQPNDPDLTNLYMYKHGHPHLQHWRNEALPVNDCFFRNMDEYKYIVNIDNDEMILSLNHTNWVNMMEDLEKETENKTVGCWAFSNAFFLEVMLNEKFENIPSDLHMMQHVYRSAKYPPHGWWTKCFLNTDNVLTHTQNNINSCIFGVNCENHFVDTDMAHFQHYRHDCYEGPSCEYRKEVIMDARIWRYLDEVVRRTNYVRQKIGFV